MSVRRTTMMSTESYTDFYVNFREIYQIQFIHPFRHWSNCRTLMHCGILVRMMDCKKNEFDVPLCVVDVLYFRQPDTPNAGRVVHA